MASTTEKEVGEWTVKFRASGSGSGVGRTADLVVPLAEQLPQALRRDCLDGPVQVRASRDEEVQRDSYEDGDRRRIRLLTNVQQDVPGECDTRRRLKLRGIKRN